MTVAARAPGDSPGLSGLGLAAFIGFAPAIGIRYRSCLLRARFQRAPGQFFHKMGEKVYGRWLDLLDAAVPERAAEHEVRAAQLRLDLRAQAGGATESVSGGPLNTSRRSKGFGGSHQASAFGSECVRHEPRKP